MQERNRANVFWGVVSATAGALFGIFAVRVLFLTFSRGVVRWWDWMEFVLRLALAVYFMWIGNRTHARGCGEVVKPPTIRWGRLLFGVLILSGVLIGHFAPGPNTAKATNETEAVEMAAISWIFAGTGIMLIAMAFKSSKALRAEP